VSWRFCSSRKSSTQLRLNGLKVDRHGVAPCVFWWNPPSGPAMWSDSETTDDLLGFDYLVDQLELVITGPRMLPVTVGVMGDWGSGKTSLLRMAEVRLGDGDGYICAYFSPWRFEGYRFVETGPGGYQH
jgi:hypothetical protein